MEGVGVRRTGLLSFSLPESLSVSGFRPAVSQLGALLSFSFLQLGRTLYFRGSGPFCKNDKQIKSDFLGGKILAQILIFCEW